MKRPAWMTPARGFAVAVLFLVVVAIYVAIAAIQFNQNLNRVAHSYRVLELTERFDALEHQTVTAQRTYLLTGNRQYADAFWNSGAETRLAGTTLKALVADNPEQSTRVSQTLDTLEQRLGVLAQVKNTFDQHGLDAAQAQIGTSQGLRLQSAFESATAEVHGAEESLLQRRNDEMHHSIQWLLATTGFGITASLLVLLAAYRVLQAENRERVLAQREVTLSNRELGISVARLEGMTRDMGALGRYAGMLQSAFTTQEALDITRQAMVGLLPGLSGTVYLLRASKDHAEPGATWGVPTLLSDPMPTPSDCWALRRNQPFLVEDARTSIRCPHVSPPALGVDAAYACIPLAAQGESLGWVYLDGPSPLPGLAMAEAACEQLSLALANLRLKEALRNQAIRDPLTGLFNRRYLEESLEREMARCQRKDQPLAVLMLDIDHFKSFNDTNGHPGGDALLAEFGRLLQSKCRADDIACRYGGEEFTVILPEASLALALERAEEIRRGAAEMEVAMRGQALPKVTISIGVSAAPEHGRSGTGLLSVADKALYEAKTGGRNRAVAAPQG